MKRFGVLSVALVLCLGAPAAWAGPSEGPDLGLALLERVQPDAAQSAAIDRLRSQLFADLETLRADLAVRRAELGSLRNAEEPDRPAIVAKQGEVEALRLKIIDRHLAYREAVHELLSEDQQGELLALVYEDASSGGPAIDLAHGSGGGDASSPTDTIDPAANRAEHTFGGLPNSLGPSTHWSNYPYDPRDLLIYVGPAGSASSRILRHGCGR